jgi:cellulose synthase operon protein C
VLQVAACGSPEDRAQSYYQPGMKLLSQQDYVKASVEFRNALQLKKDLVEAWRGLAQIEERNVDPKPLTAVLRNIVELDVKDVEAKLRLARLVLRANALDEALKLVNAAEELNNRHAGVLGLKAGILFRLGDGAGATREARGALEIDPANPDAMVVLAATQMERGDAEGALAILDREPEAHSKDIGVQLLKIKILEQIGNGQQAERTFRKLIDLYPEQVAFREVLVRYLIAQNRAGEAEKELRAWAGANPGDVETQLNLIRFLQAVKGPTTARQELLTLINAGGQVFRYQLALVDLQLAEGNFSDSVQLLENLAKNASIRENAIAAQIKLAELQLSRGQKYEAAEAIVSEILRKDGNNGSALKLRASIRLAYGQVDAAIADIRQALNDQPGSTELMLLLASAYERSGSIELAEKQYADAAKASGFEPNVGLEYAAFLQRRDNIARAEDILTELVTRWPNNISILTTLAEVRLTRQNWIGAEEIADKIRRIGSNRDLANQILGATLSGRQRHEDSIRIAERAYADSPNAVQPMVALVSALVRAKKLDGANDFLTKVLHTDPGNAEAHALLGSVHLLKNDPDQAAKSFHAAIEKQPKNMVGYRALADLHMQQKNNDEALKVIRAGLQEQPDNFALKLALAGVLVLKGEYEVAIAEYESMMKVRSPSLVVANNLASLLADHRSDKASLDRAYSLATMLRKSPVPSFKDTLGWVYHQRGDYTASISLLEEAADASPNQAMIRYHLGMSYIATSQFAKASEQLQKAREMAADDSDLDAKIKAALKKATPYGPLR